jgi:protein-S-isoprenylcysteine O-methyltransferase Ste14
VQAEPNSAAYGSQSGLRRLGLVRGLDLAEKIILLTFYGYFLLPILEAICWRGEWGALLLGVSETLVVGFVLVRKPAQHLSQHPLDWLLAFGATLAPTMVRPAPGAEGWLASVAVTLMLSGICFQIVSKLMLGRRFGIVAANRGICASGPYRLVRHPIYMGYLLTHIGFLFLAPTAWNCWMYAITYSLMVPRIFAEERLLRRDPQYAAYCGQVRSRLIPGVL